MARFKFSAVLEQERHTSSINVIKTNALIKPHIRSFVDRTAGVICAGLS